MKKRNSSSRSGDDQEDDRQAPRSGRCSCPCPSRPNSSYQRSSTQETAYVEEVQHNGACSCRARRRRIGPVARCRGCPTVGRDRVVPTGVQGSAAQQPAGGQPAAPAQRRSRSIASTAYALQVGVNRQAGGRAGLIQRWYARISRIRIRASVDRPAAGTRSRTGRSAGSTRRPQPGHLPGVTGHRRVGAADQRPRPAPPSAAESARPPAAAPGPPASDPAGSRSSRSRDRCRSRRTIRCRTTRVADRAGRRRSRPGRSGAADGRPGQRER